MQYWESSDQARAIRARAEALMDEYDIAPIPTNYELWFFYELGQDRDLRRTLDAAIENGTAHDPVRAREIHTRFFVRADERADQAGELLKKELTDLTAALTTAGEGTAAYGKVLDATEAQLARAEGGSDLRRLIGDAARATAQVQKRNKALEAQVTASSQELESLRAKMEAVRQQSLIDGLTGLANRRAFDEGLDSAVKGAVIEHKPVCVLMCDIDRFKKFNDTFGHATGDQVLRLVASILKANVKGRDLAARYGGEELVVILPNTLLADAITVAEQIRASVETKKIVKKSTGESLGQITISIGVAQFISTESAEEFLARADAHLYGAKEGGRNRVSWIRKGGRPSPEHRDPANPVMTLARPERPALELEFADQDTPLIVDAEVTPVDARLMRLLAWWKAASLRNAPPPWKHEYLSQIDFVREHAHLHEANDASGEMIVRFVGTALVTALGEDPTGYRYSFERALSVNLRSTADRVFELACLTRRMKAPLRAYSKTIRHLRGRRYKSELLFLPFSVKGSDAGMLLGVTLYTPVAELVDAAE